MEEEEQEFFLCTCGAEAILISRYRWDEEKEICLSIWEYRSPPHFDWRSRWRYIWNVIRTGYPYSDDLTLSLDDAFVLGTKLVAWSDPESWSKR